MSKIRWDKATIFQKVKRLLTSLRDVAGDDFLKKDLAQYTRDVVYKRTKSGKGVTSDTTSFQTTQPKRLTPLSRNYKKYRRTGFVEFDAKDKKGRPVTARINVGVPALGVFGTPDKSNLTLSGQMLDSMTYSIQRSGFIVYIPETIRRASKLTNAQLSRFVSQAGRPFMNLTAGESRIVKSRMRKILQQRLKKLL